MLRQLIVTVMGNVDAGKTQLLDTIRNTAIVESEPGRITQCIGCSHIPIDVVKKICGKLIAGKMEIKLPGFVIIDTPGHASFTSLRKRGGNLADFAIVVIDINEGVKPQTVECIDILKQYKTPFVIALNKLDLLSGWKTNAEISLIESISRQNPNVMGAIETKLYEAVGKIAELGLNAERFDRVEDYTKQIAIIPISAVTKEGMPELFMVMCGLSQKFLEQNLEINAEGRARGAVLEVKEEKGLGTTIDVLLYDGNLKQNDIIVIGSLGEPIVSRIKTLFEPLPLVEMRDKKAKYKSVKEVYAATGVKITGTDLKDVVAGMPLMSCSSGEIESVKEEIRKEIQEVIMQTDPNGIVIKADSLGSLEALMKILKDHNVFIKKASIGSINKKDVSDASGNFEKDPLQCAILGFNVSLLPDTKIPDSVKIITNNIIYKILDDFLAWQNAKRKEMEGKEMEFLTRPCKIKILKGYVFRQSNPAICGVEVLAGTAKTGTKLMNNNGDVLTEIKGLQDKQENIQNAEKGMQVACSMPNVTVGRQIHEETILYSAIHEEHFIKFKEMKKLLSQEEIEVLKEVAEIMRKKNPMWGI